MSDKLYTVSLKGASQNQAWVVINADDTDELLGAIEALGVEVSADKTVLQLVAEANSLYQGVANVANPSGRAAAPAGSGEPAQESQAATTAPARQRGGSSNTSTYGRKKAAAGSGGRGGKKPKLSYEEASADCQHGERRRFAKDDWVAYFCPQPKGDPDTCPANFIDAADDQEA